MNTIYFHIGTQKTGTTALQYFFYRNRSVLEEYGITFPLDYMRGIETEVFCGGPGNLAYFFEKENALFERQERFSRLLMKYPGDLLFSTEIFWNYLVENDDSMIFDMMEACKGRSVKTIVYLRPQAAYLESKYKQMVTASGEKAKNILKFAERDYISAQMDYQTGLQKLEKMIGRENIIVRPYNRKLWKDGDICSDFLSSIGISDSRKFLKNDIETNNSLDYASTVIKRVLNGLTTERDGVQEKSDPRVINEIFLRSLKKVTAYHAESGETSSRCTFLTKEDREAINARYEQDNRVVTKRYFGGKTLFAAEKETDDPDSPSDQFLTESMIAVFGDALVEEYRHAESLRSRIEKNRESIAKLKQAVRKRDEHQEALKRFSEAVRNCPNA